jgi:putative endonuclease
MPRRSYYTYALSNTRRNVLYIGVTGNLHRRLAQHRAAKTPGFTKQYRVHDLVWYEQFGYVYDAIKREKQLKAWRREWKWALIQEANPELLDLTDTLLLL